MALDVGTIPMATFGEPVMSPETVLAAVNPEGAQNGVTSNPVVASVMRPVDHNINVPLALVHDVTAILPEPVIDGAAAQAGRVPGSSA